MNNLITPKLLTVLTDPNPFLRKVVNDVKDPSTPEIRQLIEDMKLTMVEEKGIGLAAIQVGVDARVIVIETKDGVIAFVNPVIVKRADETELAEEGCLSVPGAYAPVRRSTSIVVESVDMEGNKIIHDAVGLFARVIQHEIDHLNGILFIDKIEEFSSEEISTAQPISKLP